MPLDVRLVIDYVTDTDSFLEVQRDWAQSIIVGFARIEAWLLVW